MSTPNQEAIGTFMSITGASDAVAVRKLEEHRGDLNVAVNAYFSEGDQNSLRQAPVNIPHDDAMDIDDVTPALQRESQLAEARTTVPFPLRDPNFGRSLFDNDPLMPIPPFVCHPSDVRQLPIEVNDSSGPSGRSNDALTIEDATETAQAHGPAAQGTVTTGDDTPAGSAHNNFQDYNDIEEEMILAAIEASKMETGGPRNHSPENQSRMEDDDDVTKAVTMSVKSAEEEALRSQGGNASTSEREASEVVAIPEQQGTHGRFAAPSSSSEDDDSDDVEEQPLVRRSSRLALAGYRAPPNSDPSQSPEVEPATVHSPDAGNGFPSEWGGISSEEHDEAVMLEAAMFGGIPDSEYNFPYLPHQQRAQRPPSPSLTAQRLIREQQDDEYFASLEADREKEEKAIRDAEARRLEEEIARAEALEEARRKVEEEQELERQLAAKEASLPQEPPAGEENAITLLVRMPDGTRRGRGFLKTDKLQSLFDFIDICRIVKPNTYRLVRPYPRHAFGDGESSSTLNEAGLTSKQEALFLELI